MPSPGAPPVIIERATFRIREGEESAFERAFERAVEIARAADGCHGVRLARGVESPSTYLVLIEWASVDAHVRGFRESEAFGRWAALLRPFYADAPSAEHYRAIDLP